jgi:FIMAH domain-containing protein
MGNRSDQVLKDVWIDSIPPTIGGAVDRPANARGWYNRAVTASFTYRDPVPIGLQVNEVSGIDPAASTPAVTLSAEGANQLITGMATDRASNQNSFFISGINLDMTNPTVTYSGNLRVYAVDQFINITCGASDSLSGVFSNTCRDVTGDAYNFPLGINSFSAVAVDNADNLGSGSVSFTVEVTIGSLSNLARRFVTNAGVANSLTQKLKSAGDAAARGDLNGKAHHIDVFVHELDNQTPRFITPANAAILVRLARAL